jgi:DNA repair protein RecO (recombination protein O)
MSIDKTSALVLTHIPYRESSTIVTLFTSDHGKVSGIAKGIKKQLTRGVPLERGTLIDLVLYIKPGRDLHILSDISISDFFPVIRSSLEKTAFRDIALELLIKAIKDTESHPELYMAAVRFFSDLNDCSGNSSGFILLWKFCFEIAQFLGFGIDLRRCIACHTDITELQRGAFFLVDRGGLLCPQCSRGYVSGECFVENSAISALNAISFDKSSGSLDFLRLTRLFISYCRLHMDIHYEFKSMQFLEELITT